MRHVKCINACPRLRRHPGKKSQNMGQKECVLCHICECVFVLYIYSAVCVFVLCAIDRLTKAPLKGFILIESERGSLQLPVNFDMM